MTDANHAGPLSTFRLRRRTPGSFLLVPCPHQGRSIRCQGQLEAAAATILVSCPAIGHIQEQPLSIWYRWREADNRLHIQLLDNPEGLRAKNEKTGGVSYIVPDFLVEMVDGRKRLMEIKASERLDRGSVSRKLTVARMFAEQQNWTFHLVTEKELGGGPLLENLKLVGRYRRAQVEERLLGRLEALVPASGVALSALLGRSGATDAQTARIHLMRLLATGQLSFDPQIAPLTDQTLIYPKGVIAWDPFDSVWAPSGC